MTIAKAATVAGTRYSGPATIPALMFIGGAALVYWALFAPKGLVGKTRTPYSTGIDATNTGEDRGTIIPANPTSAGISLTRFMNAIGQIESGGSYTARNRSTGAYGKYQILPSNWPSWAQRYLGNRNAPQTPTNQERVARGRMLDYYNLYHSWRLVAAAWFAGGSVASKPVSQWGPNTIAYVGRVGRILGQNWFVSSGTLV